MSKVELISLTPDAEKTMAYIARVSNPKNQENEDYSKLLSYSFTFQEFSQRYADSSQLGNIPLPELRRQDFKNRQNSIPDLPDELKKRFNEKIGLHFQAASELYEDLLAEGVAKECARFVLPLATPTRIYMSGSCRSWIHYIHLRSAHGTQKEHKSIAHLFLKKVFLLYQNL